MRPKVDRAQEVLKALVERYIQEGEPVGSKALAESMARSASPATIRNVMAELEHRGLIIQWKLNCDLSQNKNFSGWRLLKSALQYFTTRTGPMSSARQTT